MPTQQPNGAKSPTIRDAAKTLAVNEFLDYRQYLKNVYEYLKKNAPQYSYLQFSQDLGLSESNVSWLIVTGRRKITPQSLKKISHALDLKHKARIYFETMVKHNNSRRAKDQQAWLDKLLKLQLDLINESSQGGLEYLSEWYYPIIRELAGMRNFRAEPEWIAKQLNCRLLPQQIENAISLLAKLNLIAWDPEKDTYVQTGGAVKPDRSVARFAAIRYHEQMLQTAMESLSRVPAAERDYNCLTLRLDEEQLKAATAILNDALSKVFALEEKSDPGRERLYQVNVQLFPLSKRQES